ncbi:hypothetical protein EC253486_3120 [Escherichia coli 2534-86]|nr:hypothetical protein EC253486_3120 [Escherichia coli 2534-86]
MVCNILSEMKKARNMPEICHKSNHHNLKKMFFINGLS